MTPSTTALPLLLEVVCNTPCKMFSVQTPQPPPDARCPSRPPRLNFSLKVARERTTFENALHPILQSRAGDLEVDRLCLETPLPRNT